MNVLILGWGTLAAATMAGCRQHHRVNNSQLEDYDVVWYCVDVELEGPEQTPAYARVRDSIRRVLDVLPTKTPVLISSQLPVGTTAQFELEYPDRTFAYSPENLRVATAAEDFIHQKRIIVGRRSAQHDHVFRDLLFPFTEAVFFTNPETAEMCKHALNAFLGLQIAFSNELARLAAVVGGDPEMVALALLSDRRVSPLAPLHPGAPFGGGHLKRDIHVLMSLHQDIPLIGNILRSNGER